METLENIFPKKVVLKRNNKRNIEKLTYSVTEAALAITTNPQNVKDLIEMGYIGFLKLGEIRIPKTEVARFLENHMNHAVQAGDNLNEGMEKTFSEITSIKLILPDSNYKDEIIDNLEGVRSICEKIASITMQVERNKEQLEYIEQKELEIKKEISILQNYVDKSISRINCYINEDVT